MWILYNKIKYLRTKFFLKDFFQFALAVWYVYKKRGSQNYKYLLDANHYVYRCSSKTDDRNYWRCLEDRFKCPARVSTYQDKLPKFTGIHNHSCNFNPATMILAENYISTDDIID